MTDLTIDLIRDAAGFAALQPEWDALVDKIGPEAFFARHAVLTACLARQAQVPRTRLHVVTVRRGGRLVAGFPMVLRRDMLGTRVLYWLESRTPLYNCLPCLPGKEAAVFPLVRRHLALTPFLRKIKVDFVPQDSALARFLSDARQTPAIPAPSRALTGPRTAAGLSPDRQRKLAGWDRALARKGTVERRILTGPAELTELTAWIFSMKRDWVLRKFGKPGWISEPEVETLFLTLAGTLAAEGHAWGSETRLDGRRITGNLFFQQGDTIYWSKTAHEAEFASVSPGWLDLLVALDHAWAQGARRLDMMVGQNFLKVTLSDSARQMVQCRQKIGPAAWLRALMGRG